LVTHVFINVLKLIYSAGQIRFILFQALKIDKEFEKANFTGNNAGILPLPF